MGEEDSEEFKQHVYRLEHSFGQKGRSTPLKYILMGVDNLNIVYVYVPLYHNYTDFFLSTWYMYSYILDVLSIYKQG